MSERKWKSPFQDWPKDNQDANIAFTLMAKNERAIEMWKDPHNRSRYLRGSFARHDSSAQPVGRDDPVDLEKDGHQPSPKNIRDLAPALKFMFNEWPKDQAKGFVLGSNKEACDVLTGDPGDGIGEEMLTFTFNENHELVMHVTTKHVTSVTFNGQKEASREEFSWIFPRGQRMIRVAAAQVLEFDVVLPKYGINKDEFHQNCQTFLDASEIQLLLMEPPNIDVSAVAEETNSIPNPKEPFYLRGRQLGSGSYGDVYEVLRMPNRKILAAKRFKVKKSFKKEAGILKKICETEHVSTLAPCGEGHR